MSVPIVYVVGGTTINILTRKEMNIFSAQHVAVSVPCVRFSNCHSCPEKYRET